MYEIYDHTTGCVLSAWHTTLADAKAALEHLLAEVRAQVTATGDSYEFMVLDWVIRSETGEEKVWHWGAPNPPPRL